MSKNNIINKKKCIINFTLPPSHADHIIQKKPVIYIIRRLSALNLLMHPIIICKYIRTAFFLQARKKKKKITRFLITANLQTGGTKPIPNSIYIAQEKEFLSLFATPS